MKVLVGGLLTAITIGFYGTVAHAQARIPKPSLPEKMQSAPLMTQPASSNRMPGSSRLAAPYTSEQLNSTLGILQANPKVVTPAPTSSIESLIQRFSVSTPKQTTIDPIDFFKPPALNGGFKVPLSQ